MTPHCSVPETIDIRYCSMRTLLGSFDRELDAIICDSVYSRGAVPRRYEDLARCAAKAVRPGGVVAVMSGQAFLPEVLRVMAAHLRYRWTLVYRTPTATSSILIQDRPMTSGSRRVVSFVGFTLVLGIWSLGCSSSTPTGPSTATLPQTTTATLGPDPLMSMPDANSPGVTSYQFVHTASNVITVTITSLMPTPGNNFSMFFFIGVPESLVPGGCRDDSAVDLGIAGPGSNCLGKGQSTCTTATIPATLKRTAPAGSYCVGVNNLSNATETYTLTISEGSS
jgi:hypothetical protein